ncbi:GNAT family N-acetyltransferase [Paenibacillus segetis]|uniref:Acetyltransferase n=1 Tax=Paenibacillus segetis TaxID=1325360 RepID=A0ABQ1YGG5_9BACL|nr:GNAT family N-acetyltransferase [Paenibacillus segetis]GGH23542.1 acetyltransferase [Paenibacillus segetis]
MKILEKKDYYKAMRPLSDVKINTLFAEAVIEQRVPGVIYVDDLLEPTTFYVVHSYGMSLLFGESDNKRFSQGLFEYITNKGLVRHKPEWLQVDPASGWNDIIESFVDSQPSIMRNTRVNFSFNYENFKTTRQEDPNLNYDIVRMTNELYLSQMGSVVPKYFWRDVDQFLTIGVGYCLLSGGEIASTAFSAFRNEHQLEIGIETVEAYRGKGYAFVVCSALIEYCLGNQLEPVWACRLENEGSYKLAQRLGFEPTITIPYYQLAYEEQYRC